MNKTRNTFNKQEYKIIALLAEGLTAEQIGKRLKWSEATVNEKIDTMRNKLNLNHTYGLISWAYLEGIMI